MKLITAGGVVNLTPTNASRLHRILARPYRATSFWTRFGMLAAGALAAQGVVALFVDDPQWWGMVLTTELFAALAARNLGQMRLALVLNYAMTIVLGVIAMARLSQSLLILAATGSFFNGLYAFAFWKMSMASAYPPARAWLCKPDGLDEPLRLHPQVCPTCLRMHWTAYAIGEPIALAEGQYRLVVEHTPGREVNVDHAMERDADGRLWLPVAPSGRWGA